MSESSASPAVTQAALRAMRRVLHSASDTQVRRVVALVDRMAERGEADRLIEPLRPRLAQLRPIRKLRFERLLFLPLDPLIVPPREWRPGDPAIPRSAVGPFAQTIRVALGPDLAVIEALIEGRALDDAATIAHAGALLWPQAARILAMAPEPLGWTDSGLPVTAHAPLARAIAAVLERQAAIEPLIQDAWNGLLPPSPEAMAAIVDGIAAAPPDTQSIVVALLLARLPRAEPLLLALESMARGEGTRTTLRLAADRAMDAALDGLSREGGMEARLAALPLDTAGGEIRRLGAMLDALEVRAADAKRRGRYWALRQRLDAGCRTRFATALDEDVLTPLRMLTAPIGQSGQDRLERSATRLRALEAEARQIGGGEIYDALLDQGAETVRQAIGTGGLTAMRAVRLTEILAGPDAAMALMETA
jgi:hypothetical protein